MEITELDLREALAALVSGEEVLEESLFEESGIDSFEEAGLLTKNEGLVVRLRDGSEFQISIVKSGGGY